MRTVKLQQRVTQPRVDARKLLEFKGLTGPLWIRRVLVRAQEGQLKARHRVPGPPCRDFLRVWFWHEVISELETTGRCSLATLRINCGRNARRSDCYGPLFATGGT